MIKLNKKQTLIIVVFSCVLAYCIIHFVKQDNIVEIDKNELIETKENVIEENKITSEKIVVYITGAVNTGGVYELNENSRIKDAIDVAGGVTEEADLTQINLASLLEDGMKIYIPTKNEQVEEITSAETITSSSNKSTSTTVSTSKININTATQAELETLPGVGSSTAQKIIAYRKEKGKFSKIEDIKNVSGIGDVKFNNIKDLIKV